MRKLFFSLTVLLVSESICIAQHKQTAIPVRQVPFRDTLFQLIQAKEVKDSIYFYAPKLPVLGQIAGAPLSFYTYFWELGDGTFSFDETAAHVYKDTGTYTVRLFATNNFDNGKAPVIKPFIIHIYRKPSSTAKASSYFFNSNVSGNIGMKSNREPLPGEDFVTVVGYRNRQFNNLHGSLVIFYNEKEYEQKNFALADKRLYNREQSSNINTLLASFKNDKGKDENRMVKSGLQDDVALVFEDKILPRKTKNIYASNEVFADDAHDNEANMKLIESMKADPDYREDNFSESIYTPATGRKDNKNSTSHDRQRMLQSLKKNYNDNTVFRFDSLARGEEKFIFMTMNASPKMLQDTNAVITLTALMLPDDPFIQPEKYELQMQVVASHDPNRFMLRNNRIRYRFFSKKKELTYRVRFENTGKGPARKVAVAIALPKQLNPASLQIKKFSPACEWCYTASGNQSCIDTFRTGDSLYITFKNIYIPGMQQRAVKDKDSTRGFVEYSIGFRKKPKKIPFGTSARITFDKNAPIYTNKAMARFKRGISPGIVAGYGFSLSNGSYSGKGPVQIGYTVAPFSPYRPYFQLEAFAALFQQQDSSGIINYADPPPFDSNPKLRLVSHEIIRTIKRNSINLVPLHFRYNLSSWVGIGVGAMAQLVITEQQSQEDRYYLRDYNSNTPYDSIRVDKTDIKNNRKFLSNSNIAAFADLQVGRVRTGPTLGLRYLRRFKGNFQNQFFVYAAMRL